MNEQEFILTDILSCDRLDLYTKGASLTKKQALRLEHIISLRKQGLPLQYILGWTEFMGLRFLVDRRVFIPRPETELLVEETIKSVASLPVCQFASCLKILDIGTGCGCIAVSLAKYLDNVKISAIDVSAAALEVAFKNARLNLTEEKIEFTYSDLFENIKGRKFDVIISNPPYIPSCDIHNLQREVGLEPKIALDGGSDGLDFYRRIIKEAKYFLKEQGLVLMELGYNQRAAIEDMVRLQGELEILDVVKDYSGIERVIILEAT